MASWPEWSCIWTLCITSSCNSSVVLQSPLNSSNARLRHADAEAADDAAADPTLRSRRRTLQQSSQPPRSMPVKKTTWWDRKTGTGSGTISNQRRPSPLRRRRKSTNMPGLALRTRKSHVIWTKTSRRYVKLMLSVLRCSHVCLSLGLCLKSE